MLGHPAVDVVVGDIRPQVLHAGPSLLRLHLQRLPQRAGESLRIVRVDRNCPWQLVTRTGQLAEHQHATVIDLTGDELLGHQVHPVRERAHDTDVGHPVERGHRVQRQGLGHIRDGAPRLRPVGGIDPPHLVLHASLQVPVALDLSAAGRALLDEDKSLAVGRRALEQHLQGPEPLRDPFRVIQPVHTQDHEAPGQSPPFPQPRHPALAAVRACELLQPCGVNADRKRLDVNEAAVVLHRGRIAVHLRAEFLFRAFEKVGDVAGMLQAHQITTQQPVEQFCPLRTDPEHIPRRPGNMPEGHHEHVRSPLAQVARTECQMIVVHPDDGIPRHLRQRRRGEPAVHRLVRFPVLLPEARMLRGEVAEWPQRLVGVAVVESVHLIV